MSHIPSSAMKHAGPVHHDHDPADGASPKPPKPPKLHGKAGGIGTGAWLAIGGTMLVGAVAALAVPLLRRDRAPVPKRRGKKAGTKKVKSTKPAHD